METENFTLPMTYVETMTFLQEKPTNRIVFIGPDVLMEDTKRRAFGARVLETRLVAFADFDGDDKLLLFVREHIQYFKRFIPKPTTIYLHVFFDDDGDFDHETSHLPWDDFQRTRPYLSKNFEHVETKLIWKPRAEREAHVMD